MAHDGGGALVSRGQGQGLTQVKYLEVWSLLEGFTRRALMDLVVHLTRRCAGRGADLDGAELVAAIVREAEPIMATRRERMPKPHPDTLGRTVEGKA